MKRMEPNLRQPIESGDLLYDLVLAQQATRRSLKNTLYQNQTLEDFSGGGWSFKTASFVAASLCGAGWTTFPSPMCCWKTATSPEAPCATWRPSGDSARCKLMGCNLSQSLLQNTAFLNCNLRYAVLAGSKLKSVLLDGCTLEEADCSELKLKGLELLDCDLKRIQLLHTPLEGIDLRSCENCGPAPSRRGPAGCSRHR